MKVKIRPEKFRPVRDLKPMTSAIPVQRSSQRSWAQIPYRPKFFSGLIFATVQVVFITARITFIFTPLSTVQIYDLTYS